MTASAIRWLVLASMLLLSACNGDGGGDSTPVGQQRLLVQPDDGRAPIREAIAGASDNIRLTIYQITDLQSVSQNPPAPADGIAQALIDKAWAGVSVRVIVDQYNGSSATTTAMRQTVDALRNAGIVVHPSSAAFCVTHQKTLIVDGPTAANPGLWGKAIIMTFNLTPSYFTGSRDYAVVTSDPAAVREANDVFDADFSLADPSPGCHPAYSAKETTPPPSADDTPPLAVNDLLWSPANAKPKLLALIGGARTSLALTTEIMDAADMVCAIQTLAPGYVQRVDVRDDPLPGGALTS